ncbi:hypothetical protein, partial [Burkholderia sp. Bp9090]|uniref:hypothetical protein n=1 Tax=Burkholderia sp. Bp9090 TaxID=2184567 RepID=UPI001C898D1C
MPSIKSAPNPDRNLSTSSVPAKACAPDPWIWGATDKVEVERTFPRIVHVEAVRPRGVAQDL